MFRLLSILLLLAGLAAVGYGGWQMWLNANAPQGEVSMVEEAASAAAAEATEEAMVETASTRSLDLPSDEDVVFGIAAMPGEVAAPALEPEPVFGPHRLRRNPLWTASKRCRLPMRLRPVPSSANRLK